MDRDSWLSLGVSLAAALGLVWVLSYSRPAVRKAVGAEKEWEGRLQGALKPSLAQSPPPEELWVEGPYSRYRVRAEYTLDGAIQSRMEKLFRSYRPDYGAFVALDAESGRVISLVSYVKESTTDLGNLALRATFPAASIFKIITAAAALDTGRISSDTEIAFQGGDHTLYRRNVTSTSPGRWSRLISLKRAFAKSVNTVFGLVGIHHLGDGELEEYAGRFLFNNAIPGDLPAQEGFFELPTEDEFAVAEVASGYNRWVRMSPLQGALIAATVANDGVMVRPHLVQRLMRWDGTVARDDWGEPLYEPQVKRVGQVMKPEAAYELRKLMRETVVSGTALSAFAGIKNLLDSSVFEIGGKTGSLRGTDPVGNNDWFVGYALAEGRRVAVAALTVNVDKWRIKSTQIARHFFEGFYPSATRQKRSDRSGNRARRKNARAA